MPRPGFREPRRAHSDHAILPLLLDGAATTLRKRRFGRDADSSSPALENNRGVFDHPFGAWSLHIGLQLRSLRFASRFRIRAHSGSSPGTVVSARSLLI